jgi:hypothetical protein
MPLTQELPFDRQRTDSGACISTCLRCHSIAGSAFWESELDQLEAGHRCKVECIRQHAEPPPARKPASRQPFDDRMQPGRYA